MEQTVLTRIARLLLAVFVTAGSLLPASLHPCEAHVITAPAAAHTAHAGMHDTAIGTHGFPGGEHHAPDQHPCNCLRDCCGIGAVAVAPLQPLIGFAPAALVEAPRFARRSTSVPTARIDRRQPPSIGPPSPVA